MPIGSISAADRPLDDEVATARAGIEGRLGELFPPDGNLVESAMREAVQGPGKRLRPLIAILAARDLGFAGSALDVGCALELVHTASLILDDLPSMDDAPMRRGKPAIHVAFGEDVAALAAIALLSHAFKLLAAAPDLADQQRVELVATLSEAVGAGGLVGGQLDDLRGGAPCALRAEAVNARKTAALFVAAAKMACILARSPIECRARLDTFGHQLGLAFQVLDDLLDLNGNPSLMGKPNGQDIDKPTLVRLLGPTRGASQLHRHVSAASDALAGLPGRALRTRHLLESIFATHPAPRREPAVTLAGSGSC